MRLWFASFVSIAETSGVHTASVFNAAIQKQKQMAETNTHETDGICALLSGFCTHPLASNKKSGLLNYYKTLSVQRPVELEESRDDIER